MSSSQIIARLDNGVGRLTLNRPQALHALSTDMCQTMAQYLLQWLDNPHIRLVMIDHAGDRGFCAGGDIRMLAESGAGDGIQARSFFYIEYQLNALMMAYPKPILVLMDGVVMGGGVGISLPARYRVATTRTTFAMPETGIGLFPDVGGGWHLPRLPGESGLWLALTGARLKAADCLLLGLATDFVKTDDLEALKAAVIANPSAVETILTEYEADAGPPPLAPNIDLINQIFCASSVEEILQALDDEGSPFARAQRQTLLTKSPQTLKVAFRQLRVGRDLPSFEDNMAMEYRIGARVVSKADFVEGVRAVIVDKDNKPSWNPPHLENVSEAELDAIFAPLPPPEEWRPLELPR